MFEMSVGDCFSFIQNGANIKQGEVDGGYPITRIETISNNRFNRDRMGYAGITDITPFRTYVLEDGDILMSHINSVRYLGRAVKYSKHDDETIIHGMNLLRLKAIREIVIPDYACLYFSSRHFREQISRITKKSVNQASFSVADLKRAKMLIASLEEQKQIVALMSRIDGIMQTRKAEYKALDQLIKARFVEMFGTEQEAYRWPSCVVADVADVTVGVVIQPTQYYCDYGVPAFRSLNVREMAVNDNDWVYFTEEGQAKNQKSIIRENDVLVVRSGAPGVACVATAKYAGYNAVDIIIAHPCMEKVNPVFLAMFTNMPHGMNQIRAKTGGAAQQHYNVGGYKALKLILPPLGLQKEFATFVSQVDKSKLSIQASLDQLETLEQSLMQQYFG